MNRVITDSQGRYLQRWKILPSTFISEPKAVYAEDNEAYNQLREAFAKTLLEYRMKEKISRAELALRSGLGESSILLLEHEKRAPSLYTLYRLSKSFGLPLSDFVKAIESRLRDSNG